ncbi:MAG: DNA gyrase/topoisomerase IV subunit A [Flavobacteriaceae bacterium]|nr:DNA gyrase/topoisomerase IV subunit A [Flavobacteriaceae bacterium]
MNFKDPQKVSGMYQEWFLDYASYVILERAIPSLSDGLKPVQRRILHSMKELDDGRYNKVANIVGHTMQYHPHGDVSISDALVQLGQRDLLIDTQGNWGNTLTGDNAAASRYIEARLTKFALQVVYNSKITQRQLSYDGRKNEPIALPVKFPLLLAQGVEGIAVGLSTKILTHNFNELIQASIAYLKGRSFKLYPDFNTGGRIDIRNYKDGVRGSKIRVRAKLEIKDKSTIVISEIPYSTTTTSLIDSILKANDKGKIKIKKIEDNTSAQVEIIIHLPNQVSPDKTISALYAFTNCEVSISPLSCVIINQKPHFLPISEILKRSTDLTVELTKKELEVKLSELEDQLHYALLEKIFIENKIYALIENQDTWEGILSTINQGLKPYVNQFIREVIPDDLIRLTEIKIRRISKFDANKSNIRIQDLNESIEKIKHHLAHLTDYVIDYFKNLKKVYGSDKSRKSQIAIFDDVDAKRVVTRQLKLYVNKKDGFIGTSLKKDEYICECSDIDDMVVITQSGKMQVIKVEPKVFVEKSIIYAGVFKKSDHRTIYNLVYKDSKSGIAYTKRFPITSVTRGRQYDLTKGNPKSKILYLTVNPNGEAEIVTVILRSTSRTRKLRFDHDFSDVFITSRGSVGKILTKHSINRIHLKSIGKSTLASRKLWFDSTVYRLNTENRGKLLGDFKGDDQIIYLSKNQELIVSLAKTSLHLTNHDTHIRKYNNSEYVTLIYYNHDKKAHYIKLFSLENIKKPTRVLPDRSALDFITFYQKPILKVSFKKKRNQPPFPSLRVDVQEQVLLKGVNAIGKILSKNRIASIDVESYSQTIHPNRIDQTPKAENTNEEKSSSITSMLFPKD